MWNSKSYCTISFANKQQGVVLIVSLLMLLVMTMISATSMRGTAFEEKMSGHMRDKAMAFEAAEVALREAENFLETSVSTLGAFDTDGNDGLYDNTLEEIWKLVDWEGADGGNNNKVISASADLVTNLGIKTAPRYVIQHFGSVDQSADVYNLNNYGQGVGAGDVELFRITVRGTGGSDNSVVYLQTTYGKVL